MSPVGVAGGGGVSGFKPAPAGPAGADGDTGPTGPTGPTGASGENAVAAQEGGVEVVAELTALNFDPADFTVTDETGGVAGIALGSAPSFTDFTAAQHDHLDADDGGTLTAAAISDFTEVAQDAVGAMVADTATIDVTYTDDTPELKWDVKDDSITYAKLQNVSATDKLLARVTAGAGDVEEVTFTDFAQSLVDDADATAAIATLGLDADIATLSLPASTTISAFGATLVDDADATTARATLGLTIGTHVQAFDADLTTLASAFTTASGAGAATLDFAEDTDNGTNRVRLAGAASTADVTVTLPAATGTVALTSDITLATLGVDADLATLSLPASTTITAAGATLVGLSDPNADRLALWDDSASSYALAAVGTGLSISATPTLDLDADLVTLATAFTTASASGAASLDFAEDTDNGTNRVRLQGAASTADVTVTLPATTGTLYVSSGTDVALADGGTGASLADPGADRIMFWDDSAGAVDWLSLDAGDLAITTTTLALASAPTFSDFTNANHDHADADDGGQLTDAALSSAVGIAKGGTGQTTATAGFDALAPTTTQGDIIYYNGTDNVRLGPGTNGQRLTTGGAGANPSWVGETRVVNLVVGDGTSVISTGVYTDFDLPVAGTFVRWRIMATKFSSGSTGSITFDLWSDAYANFPPTVADSISTSKPTLTMAASAEDSTITDWTPEAFSAGATFRLNVDSVSLVTLCTLSLWYTVP